MRDDADAQRRVGAASLSWRRVSQVSQERARAMGQLLETAESPWGRPRCPWIGSRHGMTWQRPTACSRMGAAVRLLLSPFFATSCSRGGARAASRFGSVAEICRRALAATLALTAGALPARAPRPCKPCGRMRRLAGSSPMAWHWRLRGPQRLPTCSWPPVPGGSGWPTVSGCMASRRACSCSTRRRTCRNSYVRCPGSNPPLLICMCCLDRFCCREGGRRAMGGADGSRGRAAYRRQHFSGPAARRPLLCRPRGCLRTRA